MAAPTRNHHDQHITIPVHDFGLDAQEREIQAKASVAPRVTPADIEAEIASEFYFTSAGKQPSAKADGF